MNNTSFLPEDYLAQKAERRTNLISLTLFGVVMTAVVGAFFVTNRQARLIKQHQESINVEYQQAGVKIQELTQLEKQKDEMLHKAELAAALVERVPRSILLAELINRMPERMAMLEIDMKSARVQTAPAAVKDAKGRTTAPVSGRGKTKQEAGDADKKIETPHYKVTLTLLGVAPTDMEVSRFMMELNTYPLLREVTLLFSEQKEVDGRMMRQFKISLALDSNADVRRINPLTVPRVKNPLLDDVQLNPQAVTGAAGQPRSKEGR